MRGLDQQTLNQSSTWTLFQSDILWLIRLKISFPDILKQLALA
jgi:hypothetical protein